MPKNLGDQFANQLIIHADFNRDLFALPPSMTRKGKVGWTRTLFDGMGLDKKLITTSGGIWWQIAGGNNQMGRWMAITAAAGLLIASQAIRGEDAAPAKKGIWFPTFSSKQKKEENTKSKAKDVEAVEEIDRAMADRVTKRKKIAGQVDREEQDYFRRLEVVDRLMDQAIRDGDQEAVRKLEQLQERIQQVYDRNTAALGVSDPNSMDLAILKEKTASTKTSVTQLLKEDNSSKTSQSASRREKKQ